MKKRMFSIMLVTVLFAMALCPSAFAKEFAPIIDATNIGIQTQYKYEEPDPSWLRKLVVKEDMLSTDGLLNEEILHPVCSYPYTSDAPHFKAHVEEYIELYTLDDDSQRAAYLYLLEQIGALDIIANPETSDKSKAEWLREHGIIITAEDESDPDKKLMISALYALMKNDFYYVIKGERLEIPKGTPLEEAVVMYLMALSGESSQLTDFVLKFFGSDSVGSLDDYIYYTSLMALYTQGYVSPAEIPKLSRNEVYRRVAIMTIRSAGIAIDAETATTEEIRHKYLCAMLGTQFSVTLDPAFMEKALKNNTVPYYVLQRMAYEDSRVTISQTEYSYQECFKIVLQKTDRFDLENEFFSDIHEYNVHLDNIRKTISVNPTPVSKSGTSITINGKKVSPAAYALVELSGKEKETITIISQQKTGKNTETSIYKLNVYQGKTSAPDSDLTGLIPTLGNIDNITQGQNTIPSVVVSDLPQFTLPTPTLSDVTGIIDNKLPGFTAGASSLNENNQLVDSNGNIISTVPYETLPESYTYTGNSDPSVNQSFNQFPVGDSTNQSKPTYNASAPERTKTQKIITIVSGVCCVIFLIAIIVIIIVSKNNTEMSKSGKARTRKKKK